MRSRALPPSPPSRFSTADGAVPWRSWVALGDSFTEGLADPDPQDPERFVGWADRLAGELSARRAAAGQEPLEFANLAVRGRLLKPIVTEQLPAALDLGPDLVSIVGGGNDLLRPEVNLDLLVARLEWAVVRARRAGADVLLANSTDPVESPGINATRGRAGVLYTSIWSIARRHHAYVVDLWGMRSLRDWRMWAPDRIHLTSAGHDRVVDAALVGLGLPPRSPDWDEPLAPAEPRGAVDRARWHAEWLTRYVGPWAGRRLRRRSSGDTRSSKDAALREVDDTTPTAR